MKIRIFKIFQRKTYSYLYENTSLVFFPNALTIKMFSSGNNYKMGCIRANKHIAVCRQVSPRQFLEFRMTGNLRISCQKMNEMLWPGMECCDEEWKPKPFVSMALTMRRCVRPKKRNINFLGIAILSKQLLISIPQKKNLQHYSINCCR